MFNPHGMFPSRSSPGAAEDVPGQDRGWTQVGRERVHVPSNQDVGCRFKLRCVPKDGSRSGQTKELVSAGAVEAGPGVCTFDNRHAYTVKVPEWPSVRVVSYNVLADVYAQTELSKTVLYPYCAPYALQLDYRQNLIKKELAGYNADVVCLQEVDKGAFTDPLAAGNYINTVPRCLLNISRCLTNCRIRSLRDTRFKV